MNRDKLFIQNIIRNVTGNQFISFEKTKKKIYIIVTILRNEYIHVSVFFLHRAYVCVCGGGGVYTVKTVFRM